MRRIVPLILAVALFMEMMDATVIATSLPAIAADIGTHPIALKLAMTSYLVALAIFIPISGWMGDRFGVRNVFRASIFVFMIGSVACALAYSLPSFVGARFLQGMGGAMMTPLARLVLLRATPKNELVSAMAWLTVPALMGPMMGPPIGGFLTTYFSWHWIFLINIPIGFIGIVLSTIYLPSVRQEVRHPLDLKGFFLIGTAFAGILFGISVVSLPALPPSFGVGTFIVGVISLALYIRHVRITVHPVLNPILFKNDLFRTSIVGGSVLRLGIGATPFLLPLMLQLGFGKSPFETGQIMLFGAVGALLVKFFIQRMYARFGFRQIMIIMSVAASMGLAACGLFSSDTPAWVMSAVLLLTGTFRSSFFTGAQAISFSEIKPELMSHGTAINAVSMHLSLAIAVALAGGLLEFMAFLADGELSVLHFKISFFVVAAISITAFIPFLFLPKEAGDDITGHTTETVA